MRRGYTRRQFIATTIKVGAVGAAASALPNVARGAARELLEHERVFTASQRATLDAALARMIPAEGAGDWSAADAGAGDYIEKLLSGSIYGGGPDRAHFGEFQPLSRAKEMGWAAELERLKAVYAGGLAELDRRAGGAFAAIPAPFQDMILMSLDGEGAPFFRVLYEHTMEGVYSHPAYGGNRDYLAWNDLCYQGDVHGVRTPGIGDPDAPWNVFGGYAPEEMAQPGACPEEDP
jgi:gluconate 2-dehydrogenase gamma chain